MPVLRRRETPLRIPRGFTILFSLITLAVLLALGYALSRPMGPVIGSASLSLSTISPNADGTDDVTEITYRIRRAATISIYFVGPDGQRYDFRKD